MIKELKHYIRVGAQYRKFLKRPAFTDVRAVIGERRAKRTAVFLELAKAAVFDSPANPYNQLFHAAGCSYEDLKRSVETRGLEPTLQTLYDAGVRMSHAEFKGHQPIRRGFLEIQAHSTDFANPLVTEYIFGSSSGSRSGGTVSRRGLEYRREREALNTYINEALGLERHLHVGILPILPANHGVSRTMAAARHGLATRWYTLGGTWTDSWHYRLMTLAMVAWIRLNGVKTPFPRFLPENDFSKAAEFLAQLNREGKKCLVDGIVSAAVRVADAARTKGLDLSKTTFVVAGEAVTNAKRDVVEATGATILPTYIVSEIGFIGNACPAMNRDNTVHLMDDGFAVYMRPRKAPLTDVEVPSLVYTTLTRTAPFFLINVEMDDAGTIEPATCECGLKKLGYTRQIRNVFSYGKMTGQGTTLVGTDILRILEEMLPAQFGGSPGDYQLVELEAGAQTNIELRVHPRLGKQAAEIESYFLAQIKALFGGALTRREWVQSGGVRTIVAEPYKTKTGKILPLHLLGLGGPRQ